MDHSGFLQVTLGGLLGSGIATTVLGALLLRRTKTAEAEIKSHFDEQFNVFQSTRAWKQQALAELFGPLVMQLDRTKAAFDRWNGKNLYLEGQVVRQANQTVRDLLLSKGHLIPPRLVPHAAQLVVHYDAWMEKFDRDRNSNSAADPDFVFTGPDGFGFPGPSEVEFKKEFTRLQHELYGV